MRLFRFGPAGHEKPGLIAPDDRMIDASGIGEDYGESFFENDGLARLAAWSDANAEAAPTIEPGVRIGPPIRRPSKILCIGLNYADHAKESGEAIPSEPIVFSKASSAFCGPNDGVIIPRDSQKTDWEAELAVVISQKASYVREEDALEHVAGYVVMNDYSERSFQHEHAGQWVKGKSCDSFAPLGPFLVTPDEIEFPNDLRIWLKVNGHTMQDSNTKHLIFKVPHLVSYVSRFMTLLPGDVLSTGTPGGVGGGFDPPIFLKEGDTIELGIDGLGSQRQTARRAAMS
jgi:2,4-diketo-3-deoxy-L-fuconate hydrolase